MEQYIMKGGNPLAGEVTISGAKNAALGILAAAIMTDEDVVIEALQIHMSRYQMYRETYTVGIMRNLQKRKDMTGRIKTDNPFNRMEQADYDFEQLEKELLAN